VVSPRMRPSPTTVPERSRSWPKDGTKVDAVAEGLRESTDAGRPRRLLPSPRPSRGRAHECPWAVPGAPGGTYQERAQVQA